MSGRTALYRLHDGAGELLYVGTAVSPRRRWKQHADDKPWWPQVAYADVAWFDTRAEAELREQQVIEEECPPFNRTMAPWRVPMPTAAQRPWRDAHEGLALTVFAALDDGRSLEDVARLAGWSPRYITQLRAKRPVSFTREYIAKIRDGKGPKH